MKEEKNKHCALQNTAIRWLYGIGCSVFAQEVPTKNGIADALGIRTREGSVATYYIEAKASRSDLICLKQKCVYRRSVEWKDMGIDFYYLIVADGVRVEPELYPNWGVINESGEVIRRAKRMANTESATYLLEKIAHVLVYKVFGKLYIP